MTEKEIKNLITSISLQIEEVEDYTGKEAKDIVDTVQGSTLGVSLSLKEACSLREFLKKSNSSKIVIKTIVLGKK